MTIDDLDFESQMTLEVLLNLGGDATAGRLKEQVGVDQTQQIHYRVDEWLAPLGLVADAGETREYNGQPSKVYELTDDGEEVALQQNLDLSPELHRGQLEREIGQLLQNLDLTRNHAETANTRATEAHERIDDVKATVDGWDGQMDSLRSDVERVDNRLDRLHDLIEEDVDREQEIDDLRGDVENLEERIGELEAAIGDVEEAVSGHDEDTLAGFTAENRDFIVKIWERVGVGWLSDSADDGTPTLAERVLGREEDDGGGGLF